MGLPPVTHLMRHLPFPVALRLLVLVPALLALPLPAGAEPPPEVKVTIKTKPAQMRYDRETIKAAPGAKVTITLQNEDDLPHNLVVCKPKNPANDKENDKGMEVAMQAWNMGEAGMKRDWIPDHPRVIAYSKMVNPHTGDTFSFTAPEETGAYPFVCTFPGHAMVMNGVLQVAVPVAPIKNLHYRYYTGDNIKEMPKLGTLTEVEEGQLPAGKVDVLLNYKKRQKDYAYEFEGTLDCPKEGEYRFRIGSDDGSQLWIDGNEMINIPGVHPVTYKEKKVKLTKGEHNFKLHYFQNGGGAELYALWSGPGFNNELLSAQTPDQDQLKNDKENNYGMPLVVENEPRIYRNFIAGSSPRGIAVGYPGGVNLCWDADQMTVAMVWQGAFMDAKRHWTGRGQGDQPPLGYNVANVGGQRALGVLASPDAPWVAPYKKEAMRDAAYTFRGYELDAKRYPTFKWSYDGVAVEESFTTSGDTKSGNAALKRVVKFSAWKAPENLCFLALSGAVEQQPGGVLMVDKAVKVTVQGAQPVVRNQENRTEVLLPVKFSDGGGQAGKAEITMEYSWSAK